jgi:hypothetical protein
LPPPAKTPHPRASRLFPSFRLAICSYELANQRKTRTVVLGVSTKVVNSFPNFSPEI